MTTKIGQTSLIGARKKTKRKQRIISCTAVEFNNPLICLARSVSSELSSPISTFDRSYYLTCLLVDTFCYFFALFSFSLSV